MNATVQGGGGHRCNESARDFNCQVPLRYKCASASLTITGIGQQAHQSAAVRSSSGEGRQVLACPADECCVFCETGMNSCPILIIERVGSLDTDSPARDVDVWEGDSQRNCKSMSKVSAWTGKLDWQIFPKRTFFRAAGGQTSGKLSKTPLHKHTSAGGQSGIHVW